MDLKNDTGMEDMKIYTRCRVVATMKETER